MELAFAAHELAGRQPHIVVAGQHQQLHVRRGLVPVHNRRQHVLRPAEALRGEGQRAGKVVVLLPLVNRARSSRLKVTSTSSTGLIDFCQRLASLQACTAARTLAMPCALVATPASGSGRAPLDCVRRHRLAQRVRQHGLRALH